MPRIEIDVDRCKGCEFCIEACPQKILRLMEGFNRIGVRAVEIFEPDKCTGCTFCAIMCPDLVIEVFK